MDCHDDAEESQCAPVGSDLSLDEPDGTADIPSSPIWLEQPIGAVSSGAVGLQLGPRRYAITANRDSVKTVRFSRNAARPTANFSGTMPSGSPISSARISSVFGVRTDPITGVKRRHSGVDFAAPTGTPIFATSGGVVTSASWFGGYGLAVELDHGGGVETRYAHMSRVAVAGGQIVKKGEIIGYVGSTGRSTGPHLHYEVRHGARAVNPFGS
ncbi:peptidoglycan DD-metalloendopeptidase family protein [Altererythrobacter gangjinensis]|uniref:Peptidoglycan DD-metalloendopeptidase family protein n=2 Tax=Pontixanthobacter gangjinensis TaxID=1028742 RepID=A0A6I4SIB1_9SPHN|nr:peptidoglycan DD-metalloendopeptidase family protein [Pontixanthobacter gangjinensis]